MYKRSSASLSARLEYCIGASPGSVPRRQALPQRGGRERHLRWRAASGALLLLLGGLLVMFFVSDVFFVRSIVARGNDLMPREEIFAYADIANYHMFWLDPAQIRDNVLRSPSVADAIGRLGWPPDLITILVDERQPAIIWSDGGAETWIDLQGRAMPARAEMPHVPRVNLVKADYAGRLPQAEDFSADTVLGALTLMERLPDGASLGLSPRTWAGLDERAGLASLDGQRQRGGDERETEDLRGAGGGLQQSGAGYRRVEYRQCRRAFL